MIERVSSGILELDNLIEGGFKKSSINLIEGSPGSGKSTLAVHYMLAGIQAGEKCVYLSVEETKESFFENMERFGFDLKTHESLGNFHFHELSAVRLKDFMNTGTLGIE